MLLIQMSRIGTADFWRTYIDPQYRDRAPELFVDTDGRERCAWKESPGGPTGLA